MILPLNTDAPIYHFPYVSIGLIVVTSIIFVLTGFGYADAHDAWGPWSLHYGDGLHPVQWISSNFIHMGWFHLVGNMVFLWGFGLVVEGKLGWWRFLLVYLGIGVVQCAVEQTAMLGYDAVAAIEEHFDASAFDLPDMSAMSEDDKLYFDSDLFTEEELETLTPEERDKLRGERHAEFVEVQKQAFQQIVAAMPPPGSCGASAILFGMLAMSLVWAPKNEMTCVAMIGIRPVAFETTILFFAVWYIGWEALLVVLGGFSMSSALLHVMGAAVGFGLGVAMLKLDWVDCENWDLFAVLGGTYGSNAVDMYGYKLDPKEVKKKKKAKTKVISEASITSDIPKQRKERHRLEVDTEQVLGEIASLVKAKEYVEAADMLYNLTLRDPNARLDQPVLNALANGLAKQKEWEDAVPLMTEYVERFPDESDSMRLKLAKVLIQVEQEPKKALKTLKPIDASLLTDEQQAAYKKLVQAAKKRMAESG